MTVLKNFFNNNNSDNNNNSNNNDNNNNNNNNNNNLFGFHVQSTMVLLPNYTIKNKIKCILLKYKNISKTFKILSRAQDEVKYIEVYINREDNKKLNNLYFYLFHFYKTRKLKVVSQTVQES